MKANKENIDLLKELASLLEKNLISKEEFERQKNFLLSQETLFSSLFQGVSLFLRLFTPQFVTLLIVLLFYFPISRIISGATEVALGDTFSFKVQQALQIGDPELANTVKNLTKEEIITLISVASGAGVYSTYSEDNSIALDEAFDNYVSLQEKGLIFSARNLRETKEMVESKEEVRRTTSSDEILGSFVRIYYPESEFSPEEIESLRKTYVRLTPAGERVYWLMLDNAAEELTKIQ